MSGRAPYTGSKPAAAIRSSALGVAQLEIDLRSESATNLAEMDRRIRAAVAAGVADELARWPNSRAPISVKYDTIGIRPTGGQADDAFIVRTAMAAATRLDGGPQWTPQTDATSSDSNIPISLGIPAITINGGGRGGGSHGTQEFYQETADSYRGPQLRSPERKESIAVMIDLALCKVYKLKKPKVK